MLRQHLLFDFELLAFRLNAEANAAEDAHIDIGQPDECEDGDQQAAPIGEQQAVTGEEREKERHPVAQAVLASENVEKLSLDEGGTRLAALHAEFMGLAEEFFVRNRPGDAGDGRGEHEEPEKLDAKRHS